MTLLQGYVVFGLPVIAISVGLLAVWSARRGARRVEAADEEFRHLVERKRQSLQDQTIIAEESMAIRMARARRAGAVKG